MSRSEQGQAIEVSKTARRTRKAFWIIFSLGLSVSPIVSEIKAAQPELSVRHADQLGTSQFTNVQGPSRPWSADAFRYLAANEQTAQADGPRRRVQNQPVTEERSAEGQQPVSPVGVAPESKQEILPSWMVRTFDLPGAGVLTPKGTLIVEPYLQFAHLSSNRVTLTGFTIVPAITIGLITQKTVT